MFLGVLCFFLFCFFRFSAKSYLNLYPRSNNSPTPNYKHGYVFFYFCFCGFLLVSYFVFMFYLLSLNCMFFYLSYVSVIFFGKISTKL